MRKIAYLAMDLHANNCTLGQMDDDGSFRGNIEFPTPENNIIHAPWICSTLDFCNIRVNYRAAEPVLMMRARRPLLLTAS